MQIIKWNNRIDTLYYIRKAALNGIILVNILALLSVKIPDSDTLAQTYQRFLMLFVRRIRALLAMGIVHMVFHPGEALAIYANFNPCTCV